jgi:predicted secreted protein
VIALCVVPVSLAAAACGESQEQKDQEAQTTFTEADDGQTVKVKTGDVVTVRLAENPSTGYRWQGTLTTGLQLLSNEYTPDDPTGEQAGSGGVHEWTMQVEEAGEHRFFASYMPPGESNVEPQRFMLTLQAE